jgi:hypothetical protein
MGFVARMALATVLPVLLAAGTGCRRAGPSLADDHPGIEPKPRGRALGENLPMPDPERPTIDLSRPESLGRSLDPSSKDDVAYEAAMRGEAWAQTKVGKAYVATPDDPQRLELGINLLRAAAEQNDADALLSLSSLSESGTGMAQSQFDSFQYCAEAAKLGLAEAQHRLATMYAEGRGTTQDSDAAISWFRRAATQGYAPAKHSLALALLGSLREGESSAEALQWLESAAKDGQREAVFFLAGATAQGDFGLVKDERKAAEMALPMAEAGDVEFQFALATLFLRGEEFTDRRADGRMWLEKAAASGHAGAQQMLQQQNSPAR